MRKVKSSFFVVLITVFVCGVMGCDNMHKVDKPSSMLDYVNADHNETPNQVTNIPSKTASSVGSCYYDHPVVGSFIRINV